MAFKHYDLNLSGAAQQLSTVLPSTEVRDLRPLATLSLQADGANAGAIFVGDADVSTTSWAFRIPAAVSSVPSAPLILEFADTTCIKLSEVYVVGSLNEDLHIGVVER